MKTATTERLRNAVIGCYRAFWSDRPNLTDLKPQFWAELTGLFFLADTGEPEDVIAAQVRKVHRTLGAPGDFGYGTPCGDALRELYDACSAATAGGFSRPI